MKKIFLILMFVISLFGVNATEDLISFKEMKDFNVMVDSLEFASLESYNDYTVPKMDGVVNLLQYLGYDSGIRNQGWCGNCWVWSGTLSTELALSIEVGIKDRLSVQHFNSNYAETDVGLETACDGGWEYWYSEALDIIGKVIPWTSYEDSRGDSKTLSSSISEEVYYPVSIEFQRIKSVGVSDSVLINTVNNYLDHGKVVGFSYGLAQDSQWNDFYDFWYGNVSSDVIFMDSFSLNNTFTDGGFHAVNIVGYNEIEKYWIIQNSWGDASGERIDGTFRISYDLDLDVIMDDGEDIIPKYEFWVYDYEFGSDAGLRVEPEVDAKINIDKVFFDKSVVDAGEVITSSVKVNNDYEYMNLQNVRVSYFIPKLGMKRTVGPFDVKMFEDVMKRVYLDIPRNAKPGMYDVRVVLQTEDTKEVRYEEIEVK